MQTLTGLDLLTGFAPVRRILFYRGVPQLDRLETALHQAIDEIVDFHSRIVTTRGRPSLETGAKPLFSFVRTQQPLPPHSACDLLPVETHLIPNALGSDYENTDLEALQVLVTEFDDGWSLGISNPHVISDGIGFWQLMQRWSAHYNGTAEPMPEYQPRSQLISMALPSPEPHDPRYAVSRDPSIGAIYLKNIDNYATKAMFIPDAQIQQKKASRHSTNDILSATIWKAFTLFCVNSDFTIVNNVYDIRPCLGLTHYIGNCTTPRATQLSCTELKKHSIDEIAGLIRKSKTTLQRDIVIKEIGYYEHQVEQSSEKATNPMSSFSTAAGTASILGYGIMVNNWSKFPIYSIGFDSKPVWFGTASRNGMNMANILPHKEGVVIKLNLPGQHIHQVIQHIHNEMAN